MKKTLAIPILLAGVAACQVDDAEYAKIEELGMVQDFYEVEAEAGLVWVDYYANQPGQIRFLKGGDWARLERDSFEGDGRVGVEYDDNDGFGRMAGIEFQLTGTERRDTVLIKQKGVKTPLLRSTVSNVVVYNGGSATRVPVETNLKESDLDIRTVYTGGTPDWIRAVSIDGDTMFLTTVDNPDPVNVRSAVLQISFVDGWDERLSLTFYVTQANATNNFGAEISFEDLRSRGVAGERVEIEDNVFLNAYVVSDPASGNVNDIPSITTTTRDYSIAASSAYLESLDGKYGFLVITETEEDNIFKAGTRVQLMLQGATLLRRNDPERYEISGITSSMLTRSQQVDASVIPQKKLHIADLTDADIYTRVELLDCEYPVRKGSMTPVHEGYTLATGAHRTAKAAVLVRDIQGSSLYVYTNMTCPYRRDGSRMGYGRGTMKGVVVHEKFRPFIDEDAEDEEDCGNIGRYQIRHQSRADFDFADDFHDGFSEMICEWRYLDKASVNREDKTFAATYGEGRMRQNYLSYTNSGGPATMTSVRGHIDFSYLGPIGDSASRPFGNHRGNENGFGIILEDGTDYGADDSCANIDGKGQTGADCPKCILAWGNPYWWNGDTVYSWEITFSTAGIETDRLSMQLSVLNESQAALTPRFWKAEWAADGGGFQQFAEYTVPDVGLWANTLPSQCLQFKPMDFPLPLEMLGHSQVTIRLTPANHRGSDGQAYANANFGWSGSYHSCMNYFAIRYNK